MLKSIKAEALALVITAAVFSMTDTAQAYYCYYEYVWTPYGYVYQYVCF